MRTEIGIDPHIASGSRSRWVDWVIAALAERQHGVVSRDQLERVGVTGAEIDGRVRGKRLHPVHLGVYAVGHRSLSREGELLAAILAGGEGALLSHRSAAELWGMLRADGRQIDVIADTRTARPGIRFHRNKLEPRDMTMRRGIPVTTPIRTIIDLAASGLTPPQLERAVRQAEYYHLLTTAALTSRLTSLDGRRGIRALRQALEAATDGRGITRSELERRFLRVLRTHALPSPDLNVQLQLEGKWIEADCVWPERGLIVELDSKGAHANDFAFESDRARDRALQAAGWIVIRITWRQLRSEPEAIAAHLRALLERS